MSQTLTQLRKPKGYSAKDIPQKTIQLPPLHDKQIEIVSSDARFRVVCCGRGFGKTHLGAVEALKRGLEGQEVLWVAPTNYQAHNGFEKMREFIDSWGSMANQVVKQVNNSPQDKFIEFVTGGKISIRPTENNAYERIRGKHVDFAIVDECALVCQEAWTQAIRPALTVKKGSALLISTPRGYNWFHSEWVKGCDDNPDKDKLYQSWKYPSALSPLFDDEELANAERQLPKRLFQQEYLAEFNADGSIFPEPDKALSIPVIRTPEIFIGVDLAGAGEDETVYTVISIAGSQVSVVDLVVLSKVRYATQTSVLAELVAKWCPRQVLIEENGHDAYLQQLEDDGFFSFKGFRTSYREKLRIVEQLELLFQDNNIAIDPDLNDVEKLVFQLKEFAPTITPTGKITYRGKGTTHDDMVMSLAFAVEAWKNNHSNKWFWFEA